MSNFHSFENLNKNGILKYNKLQLQYIPKFLCVENASNLYSILKNSIEWENERFQIMGKNYKLRRKVAFYGNENIFYKYSGSKKIATPWTEHLNNIKYQIEKKSNVSFNSVLCNDYDDGNVHMGWHSDDEKELGLNPVIASLSIGGSRDFLFKHKNDDTSKKIKINLKNGSLLIMKGQTQHFWNHSLPKRRGVFKGRINLTFRNIIN